MGEQQVNLTKILAENKLGVLATIRRDGRPQLSNVMYAYDAERRLILVSVTADRAKTRNVLRDPRAVIQVQGGSPWQYAVADGAVTLSPVTEEPGDAAGEELVELYRTLSGEHEDWDAYRADMIAQRRQVLRLSVDHLYGIG
ncbi:PPOX class F420-dependent enzyme [Enemella dayhoffiae]|uniref:PPOX class F420-dependent enzyme n=1 Tax=Enemella dayhoffiae TaxID=2016507 RepID=A0A255H5T3_9ACTN|nr:PPOX class F420-dependent oxidoreductase [Enemella dayhoffiae]OYO21874.1 PPOX class F420-dependent enzyme [Enemella dayhoffiae]